MASHDRLVVVTAFVLSLAVTGIRVTSAFGYLSFPPATYRDLQRSQIFTTEFNASIHPTFFALRQEQRGSTTQPNARAALFVNQLAFADYFSLREIADTIYPDCGNSVVDDSVKPVNVHRARYLLWRNEDEKVGFYPKTSGPCETWIDNERVQFNGDCVHAYASYPAKVPVDFSRCHAGRVCLLRFYWIAVATNPMKLMKHCVRITNDPTQQATKENTEPYKTPTTGADTSFSIDLTITWERIWVDGDELLDSSKPTNPGMTILVIP